MSLRTLVISDLHLGRPDPIDVVAALEPVLSQTDEVILNGDVAELRHPTQFGTQCVAIARAQQRRRTRHRAVPTFGGSG